MAKEIEDSSLLESGEVGRRGFIKGAGAVAGALAVNNCCRCTRCACR
ncbi:MAG: twin-arginine translocation signal domain-containing protein [Actinomycetota bacterium]